MNHCTNIYSQRIYHSPTRRAFTIIEILIVIVVLSILAMIALPTFSRAREVARRASCASNLRQLGMAFTMYIYEWDGCFPNTNDPYLWMGRRWRWALAPYLGSKLARDPKRPLDPLKSSDTPSMLLCPSDELAPKQWDSTSYGYGAAFYHTPAQIASMTTLDLYKYDNFPCITQREKRVSHPDKKVLLAEWLTNHDTVQVGWWDWRGARNYLFVDGHARYLHASKIKPAVNGLPDPNLTVGGIEGRDVD